MGRRRSKCWWSVNMPYFRDGWFVSPNELLRHNGLLQHFPNFVTIWYRFCFSVPIFFAVQPFWKLRCTKSFLLLQAPQGRALNVLCSFVFASRLRRTGTDHSLGNAGLFCKNDTVGHFLIKIFCLIFEEREKL